MSQLQQDAKPILVLFITGQWLALDDAQRKVLAAWATMFSIMLDATHPENSGVSQEERKLLMETLTASPGWLAWMGVGARPLAATFIHDGWQFADLEKVQQLPSGTPVKCNAQTNVFACGYVVFQTFSTHWPSAAAEVLREFLLEDADAFGIRALWPASQWIADTTALAFCRNASREFLRPR